MIRISICALTLVLLIPQLPVYGSNDGLPFKIGFSCCHFYDPDSGTPVFMHGEEIWIKAERDLTAVLLSSNQEIASRKMLAHSSTRLYVFKAEDRPGPWELAVQSGGENFIIPLYLVRPQAEASLAHLAFNLTGTQLAIRGTVAIEKRHQGGVLLLNREDRNNSLVTPPVPFRNSSLEARISWDPANPRNLSVSPYSPELTSPNASRIWAEVSLEIPLVKRAGATQVFTFSPQIVTQTNRITMNIESEPRQALKVRLPNFHEVGPSGQVPLRLGPIRLTAYVEIERTIYVLATDLFLLTNGFASTAGMIQVPPMLNPVSFEVMDDLQRISACSIVLMTKETGVYVVWDKTIAPPVSRMQVASTLTNSEIEDYDIRSGQILEAAKVGFQTFVIPRDSKKNVEIELSIGGVPLQPNDFNPRVIALEPLSTVDIRTPASTVHLRVTDALGSLPSSGTIRLTRIIAVENKASAPDRSWDTAKDFMNMTLPVGDYEIEMRFEGSTVTRQFSVRQPTEFIIIRLNEFVFEESRNGLIFIGFGSVVIIIEAFVAIRLWKTLVTRRKSRIQAELNSGKA